jgi:hypothetical protein
MVLALVVLVMTAVAMIGLLTFIAYYIQAAGLGHILAIKYIVCG